MKFPDQNQPHPCILVKTVESLRETGSSKKHPRLSRFTNFIMLPEDVLGYRLTHPECSVKDISEACWYSKRQIWKILNKYGAYPYRLIIGKN